MASSVKRLQVLEERATASRGAARPERWGDVEGDGRRVPLSLRTTERLRSHLDHAAKASGRSLTQEVEFRLEASVAEDRIRTLIREELALVTLRSDDVSGAPLKVSLPNMSRSDLAEWLRD